LFKFKTSGFKKTVISQVLKIKEKLLSQSSKQLFGHKIHLVDEKSKKNQKKDPNTFFFVITRKGFVAFSSNIIREILTEV